ncbi:major facilitator superfamily domain-containing protein [Lipomyces arxii]|uniref:major facilitator superfamily domain-containing protein n=1 Tax=Lipomyces arxii TaxID=56418 RepID=UPI0034CD153A
MTSTTVEKSEDSPSDPFQSTRASHELHLRQSLDNGLLEAGSQVFIPIDPEHVAIDDDTIEKEENYTGPDPDKYLVEFVGLDDPSSPLNWSVLKKSLTTLIFALCTFGPQFGSSVYGPITSNIAELYHVSSEVATLGSSLYLLGIGFGPMLFAPISELFGRKVGVIIPFFISGLFAIGCATATNLQTIIIMRFFQGMFGGAPVANTGGVLGDIWKPEARATAIVMYSFVVAGSTTLAPVVGAAFSVQGHNGWRWAEYFCAIYSLTVSLVAFIFAPETYHPILLANKAKKMRLETKNWAWHARHDEWDFSLKEIVTKHLARPFAMLLTPIVALICTYAAFTVGILYMGVIAVPVEFLTVRKWGKVPAYCPTIAMFIGILCGGMMNIVAGKYYARTLRASGGKPVPEARLVVVKFGCFLLPIGLFIFGWTADPQYPWIAPVIGIAVFTVGFFVIFQGCLNYLIDAFLRFSASAIAATTFTRSCFAAAFPLFGRAMFENLTVAWGASLIGFIAILMIPIPFVFHKYGVEIRKRNPYAKQVM